MLYYHMELNFYYHVNKSLFKSASILESVLWGSSMHKAMSSVQNRHTFKSTSNTNTSRLHSIMLATRQENELIYTPPFVGQFST